MWLWTVVGMCRSAEGTPARWILAARRLLAQEGGRIVLYVSSLTYLVDLFHQGLDGTSVFPVVLDIIALILFTFCFLLISNYFYRRNMMEGL